MKRYIIRLARAAGQWLFGQANKYDPDTVALVHIGPRGNPPPCFDAQCTRGLPDPIEAAYRILADDAGKAAARKLTAIDRAMPQEES